jgi:hypothetical protein
MFRTKHATALNTVARFMGGLWTAAWVNRAITWYRRKK